MGLLATAALLMASDVVYSAYPVFGDKEPRYYNDARVNVVIDRGAVRELIVSCGGGELEGVLIHDTLGDAFCDAKGDCHTSLGTAIARTCR